MNLSDIGKDALSLSSQLLTGGAIDVTDKKGWAEQLLNPDLPPLPKAPLVPTYDMARQAADRRDQLSRRRGRAASILSERPESRMGYTGGGSLAVNTLLGG